MERAMKYNRIKSVPGLLLAAEDQLAVPARSRRQLQLQLTYQRRVAPAPDA